MDKMVHPGPLSHAGPAHCCLRGARVLIRTRPCQARVHVRGAQAGLPSRSALDRVASGSEQLANRTGLKPRAPPRFSFTISVKFRTSSLYLGPHREQVAPGSLHAIHSPQPRGPAHGHDVGRGWGGEVQPEEWAGWLGPQSPRFQWLSGWGVAFRAGRRTERREYRSAKDRDGRKERNGSRRGGQCACKGGMPENTEWIALG